MLSMYLNISQSIFYIDFFCRFHAFLCGPWLRQAVVRVRRLARCVRPPVFLSCPLWGPLVFNVCAEVFSELDSRTVRWREIRPLPASC